MRISLSSRGVLAIPVLLLAMSLPVAARAQAGEDEVFVTVGADYSARPDFRADSRGIGGSMGAFWGFHRWFSVGAMAAYAHEFPLPRAGAGVRSDDVLTAFAGVGFNIDVTRVVPFVWVGPGISYDGETRPAARVAFGFDYRPRRAWALGADLAWQVAGDDGAGFPGYSVLRFRVSRIIGLHAL